MLFFSFLVREEESGYVGGLALTRKLGSIPGPAAGGLYGLQSRERKFFFSFFCLFWRIVTIVIKYVGL